MSEETDLNKTDQWEHKLIRKYGPMGAIDRKRASLRRQAKRRFVWRGLLTGFLIGLAIALIAWTIAWGW